jgi:hypothetical protein
VRSETQFLAALRSNWSSPAPRQTVIINHKTSGTKTPFIPNQPNLVILQQIINHAPGEGELTYGWVNPSSVADLISSANIKTFSNANFVEGSRADNNLVLNAASAFAFSRRLHRRMKALS